MRKYAPILVFASLAASCGGASPSYLPTMKAECQTGDKERCKTAFDNAPSEQLNSGEASAPLWQVACEGSGDQMLCYTWAIRRTGMRNVEMNHEEATDLFERLCSDGHEISCKQLACLYSGSKELCVMGGVDPLGEQYTNGFPPNVDKAQEMFSELGVWGYWRLGEMYNRGLGVDEDRDKAVEWYEKACAEAKFGGQGDKDAMAACSSLGDLKASCAVYKDVCLKGIQRFCERARSESCLKELSEAIDDSSEAPE